MSPDSLSRQPDVSMSRVCTCVSDVSCVSGRCEGLLVHGFSDLMGAEEIAPGTRIYKGGWENPVHVEDTRT